MKATKENETMAKLSDYDGEIKWLKENGFEREDVIVSSDPFNYFWHNPYHVGKFGMCIHLDLEKRKWTILVVTYFQKVVPQTIFQYDTSYLPPDDRDGCATVTEALYRKALRYLRELSECLPTLVKSYEG